MNFLNSRAGGYAALALVVAVIGYVVVKRLGEAADDALDDYNKGTAYDSSENGTLMSGVHALGNATNQVSGGVLQRFGEWISGTFFDPNADYDPNAPANYAPRKAQVRAAQ